MTRYPLDPLANHLGIRLGQIGGHQPDQHPSGMAALAERLNLSITRLYRLRRHGLSPDQADRLAIATGAHPSQIWPSWFADAPDDLHGTAHHNATKTTCPRGHAYDAVDNRGYRICRQCRRNQLKKCRQNHKHPGRSTHFTQPALPGVQHP